MTYAGFWIRLFAGLLDMIFLLLPFVILSFFFGSGDFEFSKISNEGGYYSYFKAYSTSSNNFSDYLGYAISIAYVGYFLSSKRQATIGKSLMGIYVGNPDGSKLSPLKSIGRASAAILTSLTLGIGFLIVVFTKEKTALHDIICKTRVFYGKKNG